MPPDDSNRQKPLTYASYLELDELLSLQRPRSEGPEHDETLFIVIHQVYELWFKEVLHELDHLRPALHGGDMAASRATLTRIRTILKTLVGQIDILETMTPTSFNSFRDRLEAASGFESYQFREIEFVLGRKRRGVVDHYPEGSEGRARLEARLEEPTVYDAFLRYLVEQGYEVPPAELERDVSRSHGESAEIQRILLAVYRDDPINSQICERLVDIDEGMQEWRYRHVKMVERTIGTKRGTGGSSGAEYLRSTLFEPLFPNLWAIRVEL